MNSIETFITEYLVERGAALTADNWQNFDLISSGVIDSFEALSFLLVINNKYGTHIKPHEFSSQGFNRLGNLVEYLISNKRRTDVV
ncbi:hypothetical protein P886_2936 [Alteromonadaceae bacterium 2753L.S.0a.02]|nr:hypothetical protein P886_2936 [Alteromonadaceae bacterium 2753L.S.0a.02]